MANPKRKHSKSRRDKRRANWKASAPTVTDCSNCGQPKLPHRACPNCGYYKGRSVFLPRES
ncbi:50S ribosomal protein L32 [candidate division KSB1 bacterium]|jgi:large subunit ribosomal protein L32|nr:50S ribosomal protein L32 [candidate division KSB1 bacterium]